MLDSVGLVHMNGRVYDPFLGRMISADPTVPGALNSQAFNRYSYVLNNPLSLTDPSGFSPVTGGRSPNADGAGGHDFGLTMPNEGCTGPSATACSGSSTAASETFCGEDGECITISGGSIVGATSASSSQGSGSGSEPADGQSGSNSNASGNSDTTASTCDTSVAACLEPVSVNGRARPLSIVDGAAAMAALLGSGKATVWPTLHPGVINNHFGWRDRWNPAAPGGGQMERQYHLAIDLMANLGELVLLSTDAIFWGIYTVQTGRAEGAGVAYFYVPSAGYAIQYMHVAPNPGLIVGVAYPAGWAVGISNGSGTSNRNGGLAPHLHYGIIFSPTMTIGGPNRGLVNGLPGNPIFQLPQTGACARPPC
jgi:RHS repeat-associated protein